MSKYEQFIKQMKAKGASEPYMSEADFNIAFNIKVEVEPPLFIARRTVIAKEIKPTLKEYVKVEKKPKCERPLKTKRIRKVIISDEERKLNRTRWMREKREEWKAQGLTTKGKPPKQKGDKPEPTTEAIRAKRREYARTYRTKNREKHLQSRRDLRARKKLNQCV